MKSVTPYKSLIVRIIALTLLLFLGGIWSLFYFNSRILKKEMLQLIGDQQRSTATIVASEIDQRMGLRMRSLETFAHNITSQTFSDTKKLQLLLNENRLLLGLFNGGVYAIRADGTAIADIPIATGRIGMNVSEKGWMQEALQGKSVVGKPVIGKMLKNPVFTMATPVRDTGGAAIGVIAAVIDLSKPNFLDNVIQNHYGNSGGFLLLDKKHRLIVTASDKNRIMETLPPPGVHETLDLFFTGHQGVEVTTNLRSVSVVAVARPVPTADWLVAILLPTAEAFAPIRSVQMKMVLAAVFLTTLTGLLIWLVLRWQMTPMLEAIDTLSGLAESDLPLEPLTVRRHDEVGQLLHAFNVLIAKLTEREARLTETQEQLFCITSVRNNEFLGCVTI